MGLTFRNTNGHRVKCALPLPLIIGFVFGILSVYTYYLLLDYEDVKTFIPVALEQGKSRLNLNYHKVDLTKPTINNNVSLLCLIFINNIDSVLMQHNIWLDKCGKNIMYVSKQKYMYIDHVVTDTYSTHSWKYYCQTLMYLHTKYNSGINKYDWVFLANDNVWLIYENLIHLITLLNVNQHNQNYYAGQYDDGVLNTNAGVLLSSDVLTALVNFLSNTDACNSEISNYENQMLDFYLKKLNKITPISNMDSFGCTLFHSVSLTEAFNVKSLRPKKLKKCISNSAITFQLDVSSNNIAMFYKYALYKVRLVTKQDLISSTKQILPSSNSDDVNIWWIEAFYELNLDPRNMSQTDFFHYWTKKRKIIL